MKYLIKFKPLQLLAAFCMALAAFMFAVPASAGEVDQGQNKLLAKPQPKPMMKSQLLDEKKAKPNTKKKKGYAEPKNM